MYPSEDMCIVLIIQKICTKGKKKEKIVKLWSTEFIFRRAGK